MTFNTHLQTPEATSPTIPVEFNPLPRKTSVRSCPTSNRSHELRFRADGGLERLRQGLLAAALAQVQSTALVQPIRRAAHEAAALAWLQEHPLLVFPCLFQEKVEAARRHAQRQLWVEAETSDFFETTA